MRTIALPTAMAGTLLLALASPALGQAGIGVDVSAGRWWPNHGFPVETYSASYFARLLGPVSYGLGFLHQGDRNAFTDRTMTGGLVTLAWARDGGGLYAVASGGMGMRHVDGNLDATWSAGAGWALRPLAFLSVALEVRYRVEDRFLAGFWRLRDQDRRGFAVEGRLAFGGARRGGARPTPRPAGPSFLPPPREDVERTARGNGASPESARAAADVVQTALDAMGTPYRWGGSGDTGYDCSGLIQFAYGEHGILLPRVSRDQARMGTLVDRDVDRLRPADILAFSVDGGGVSHVGLYVGDGQFIHSSSTGVKLSSLTGTDGDSRYWRQRWVEVRRILN